MTDTFVSPVVKWRPDGQVTDYSVVGLDHLDGVKVSTIWLGLDHSFGGERPVIFETLIFGGEWDGDLRRYSTYAEALGGHAQAVNNVHRGRAPW